MIYSGTYYHWIRSIRIKMIQQGIDCWLFLLKSISKFYFFSIFQILFATLLLVCWFMRNEASLETRENFFRISIHSTDWSLFLCLSQSALAIILEFLFFDQISIYPIESFKDTQHFKPMPISLISLFSILILSFRLLFNVYCTLLYLIVILICFTVILLDVIFSSQSHWLWSLSLENQYSILFWL